MSQHIQIDITNNPKAEEFVQKMLAKKEAKLLELQEFILKVKKAK